MNSKSNKKIFQVCAISALFAAIIFIIFCAINKFAPFGSNTILRNDAVHQYAPFLSNYIQRIKDGSSLLYSWNVGGGVNQFSLIAYYLLSPFNLLALPFNSSNIEIAFLLIILVKTICMSGTASYYFQKKSNCSDLISVVFSLVYTFSGFYICYYYNTMWLDALIMLPLIALGIENIVNGKKLTLYFFSLTYTILVNFYIGYMICIFSVLYFLYLVFSKDITDKNGKNEELPIMQVLLKYGAASLFAGLICAFVILPVICSINYGANKSDFDTVDSLFNFFDFLCYHLTGIKPVPLENTDKTAPYLMSSMMIFLTAPTFFFLKNIKPNKKVATAVVLAIFYFSFSIPKMNYFWHGFSAPANLPYRFSFIYLFFLITLAYEVIRNIKELPIWSFAVSGVLIAISLLYTKFSAFNDHFNSKMIWVSLVAAVVYLVFVVLYKYDKLNVKLVKSLICIALVAEIVVGNYQSFIGVEDKNQYFSYTNEINEIKECIGNDNSFVRFEIADTKKNLNTNPALYTYNGISNFSSLSDGDFSGTQQMLGNCGNLFNSYMYVAQSPIYNAMFSLQYVYDADNQIEEGKYYEKVKNIGDGTLYKVKYTLPIGYCVQEDIQSWSPYNYLTTSVQSLLWRFSTGVKNVMLYSKPEKIEYHNCYSVSPDEISQYIKDNVVPTEDEDEHNGHVHNYEEESEYEYKSKTADLENASQYEFVFSAENVSQIVAKIGDVYSFKATDEDFSISFNFVAKEEGEIVALANSGCMQTLTVVHEDGRKKNIDISERHISNLGYFVKGERYTIIISNPDRPLSEFEEKYPLTDSIQMSVASINEEKFKEGYNKILENGTLDVKEFDDTYIYGTVKAKSDCVMMMPMPYDEGWTVYIDGEPVELKEHESHIMMFDMPQGEHEVEMSYFPLGLKEGLFVSAASILGIVMVLLLSKVHKMKKQFIEEEEKKESEKKDME